MVHKCKSRTKHECPYIRCELNNVNAKFGVNCTPGHDDDDDCRGAPPPSVMNGNWPRAALSSSGMTLITKTIFESTMIVAPNGALLPSSFAEGRKEVSIDRSVLHRSFGRPTKRIAFGRRTSCCFSCSRLANFPSGEQNSALRPRLPRSSLLPEGGQFITCFSSVAASNCEDYRVTE